jgi:hypothetical protein
MNYLDARYLPSLRRFLSTINGHLELAEAYIVPLQRQGDHHIMDTAQQSNQFTASELRSLNYCRLSLDVTTVADITNVAGTSIIPDLAWGEAVLPHRKQTPPRSPTTTSNILLDVLAKILVTHLRPPWALTSSPRQLASPWLQTTPRMERLL